MTTFTFTITINWWLVAYLLGCLIAIILIKHVRDYIGEANLTVDECLILTVLVLLSWLTVGYIVYQMKMD